MRNSKRLFILLVILSLAFYSCTSDDTNIEENQITLLGKWELAEFKVKDGTTDPEILLVKTIIDKLIARNCKILEYDFRANGKVISESTILDIDPDMENTSCPQGVVDSFTGTWKLENDILTFSDGQSTANEGARISLTQNRLLIYGEGLSLDSLSGTEFILRRK